MIGAAIQRHLGGFRWEALFVLAALFWSGVAASAWVEEGSYSNGTTAYDACYAYDAAHGLYSAQCDGVAGLITCQPGQTPSGAYIYDYHDGNNHRFNYCLGAANCEAAGPAGMLSTGAGGQCFCVSDGSAYDGSGSCPAPPPPTCTWPQILNVEQTACIDPPVTCDHAAGWQVAGPPVAAGVEGTAGQECISGCVVYGDHFEVMPDGSGIPWYIGTGASCASSPSAPEPEILPLEPMQPLPTVGPEPTEPTAPPTADPIWEKLNHMDWQLSQQSQQNQQIIQHTKGTEQAVQELNGTMSGGGGGPGCGANGIPCSWDSSGAADTLPDAVGPWETLKGTLSSRLQSAHDAIEDGLALNLPGATCQCGSGVTVMGININICVCDYLWALEYLAMAMKVAVGFWCLLIIFGI